MAEPVKLDIILDSNKEVVVEPAQPADLGPIDPDTLIPM